jgi:hypothetical protein
LPSDTLNKVSSDKSFKQEMLSSFNGIKPQFVTTTDVVSLAKGTIFIGGPKRFDSLMQVAEKLTSVNFTQRH